MSILQKSIEVSRPVHEAFAYIADFSTTQEWDSTATRAEKLTPGPVAIGTRFAVNCAVPVGSIDLEYTVTRLEADAEIELSGVSRFFDISDRISFTPTKKGTRIDYRAEFKFPPALQRLDKFFEAGLQGMGEDSMEGMRAALDDDYPVPPASRGNKLGDRLLMPGLAKFTRFGYSRSMRMWAPNSSYLGDKHVVITGASAGLGSAAAMELARRGARLTLEVRDNAKGQRIVEEITTETGNDRLRMEVADLSLLADVDKLVRRLRRRGEAIDVLVNNAGALFNPRQETAEGTEASLAYVRAKRALMVVSEEWATDWAEEGITVNAMHPGWADTPGVESALPKFHKLTRHFLRNAEQGADTIVWLASAREAGSVSGKLFLDREVHTTHLLPSTRESYEERQALMGYLSGATRPSRGGSVGAALASGS